MIAALKGFLRIVRILLSKGANVSIVDDAGFTALHMSAEHGHLAVTKLLMKAGSDLEAANSIERSAPMHMAAHNGHSELVSVLIEAGANPNGRRLDGATPLYLAAQDGHLDAVKVLLRAKADPLLTRIQGPRELVPLDMAAKNGHLDVVRELIQQFGMDGCGGDTGGVCALECAAQEQRLDVMALLTGAGVVDTGAALVNAAIFGGEASVKFLLQQGCTTTSEGGAYVNVRDSGGRTPLLACIVECLPCAPRLVRLLVDAGADTALLVQFKNAEGVVVFNDTPLALTEMLLRLKSIRGEDAIKEQLHAWEAIRRLLLRVDAVHAFSWLWQDISAPVANAAVEGPGRTKVASAPLMAMLPILRQRARGPKVLLSALFRNSVKP